MSNWQKFGAGLRPVVPPEFYRMPEEEIVRRLMDWGESEKMARREAKAFSDYLRGLNRQTETTDDSSSGKDDRIDSVSEKGVRFSEWVTRIKRTLS